MATAEGEVATEDDVYGPPPPARGTAAYEEMVLRICAAEGFDEFNERVRSPWEYVGWRLGLDVTTEILFQYARSWGGQASKRDAFGNLKLPDTMEPFSEEKELLYAAEVSRSAEGGQLAHEAFKEAIETGEEIREFMKGLTPVCHAALNQIVRTGRKEGASATLLRFLNTHPERLIVTSRAMSLVFGGLRATAMPVGEKWVAPHLMERRSGDPALLHGNVALENRLEEMGGWGAPGMPLERAEPLKGKHPRCTCGQH